MEALRSNLYKLIGDYLGQIAINTFPANNPERQTVPPEWEEKNSKHFFEVVGKLHQTAGELSKPIKILLGLGAKSFPHNHANAMSSIRSLTGRSTRKPVD